MSALKESQHLKIPLKEIEIATNNFQECIGKGGYGMVYKGILSIDGNPTAVAVKRLNEQFGQGLKEFLMEIQLLTGQNHPNLISLLGYCDEGNEKIIVYEYARNGSLDQYLRCNSNSTKYILTWVERLKICVGAARGLNHLHYHVGKHQTIIHRDIKSSNILLDGNWAAKVSDLGLSKLSIAGLNKSYVISNACGTQGYCEPEYFSTGIVKKESDVYSFGMVLFEVFCGRLCFITDDDGFRLSAALVKDYYIKKKLDEIVDPTLRLKINFESMNKFSSIAYQCLHVDREQRPPMHLVKKELEDLLKMELPSYALESPPRISSFNKASDGSDVGGQGFDDTLQARAGNAINRLDDELKDSAMSFLLEGTATETNQDEVNAVLDSKGGIWKDEKLVKLVEDYLERNMETFDLCGSLMTSVNRLRKTYQLILEALDIFDEEDRAKENVYEKMLDNLKNFKAAGSPFTQDFFWILNFVHRRQIAFLVKLKEEVKPLKVSNQTWVYSLLKNHKNPPIVQKEVCDLMERCSYAAIQDIEQIRHMVDRLEVDIESLMMHADFASRSADYVQFVMVDMKKKRDSFFRPVEDLKMIAYLFISNIHRASEKVRESIIKPASNHLEPGGGGNI